LVDGSGNGNVFALSFCTNKRKQQKNTESVKKVKKLQSTG